MINPTDRHVGSRLRMRRRMLNMSQADLAKTIGVTFQQVQKYEKGKNRVSASRLQQVGRVLDVPIEFFFDGLPSNGQMAVPSYVNDFLACADGVALVKAFTRISDKKLRRAIVALVEAIGGGSRPEEGAT